MHQKSQANKETIRADKLLSSLGIASRRSIEKFVSSNAVMANDVRIKEHGQRIPKNASITINGKKLIKPKKVYFLLNKPKGIVSTSSDEFNRRNVVSLIKTDERIFPIGRLDRDTHGLLILTNDGELTNMLIHPRYHVPKTYLLKIKGQVTNDHLESLTNGVELDDGVTAKAKATVLQRRKDGTIVELTIFEGRKRQIRRMCDALNLTLLDLERIKLGTLDITGIKLGEYRELSGKEIEDLRRKSLNKV